MSYFNWTVVLIVQLQLSPTPVFTDTAFRIKSADVLVMYFEWVWSRRTAGTSHACVKDVKATQDVHCKFMLLRSEHENTKKAVDLYVRSFPTEGWHNNHHYAVQRAPCCHCNLGSAFHYTCRYVRCFLTGNEYCDSSISVRYRRYKTSSQHHCKHLGGLSRVLTRIWFSFKTHHFCLSSILLRSFRAPKPEGFGNAAGPFTGLGSGKSDLGRFQPLCIQAPKSGRKALMPSCSSFLSKAKCPAICIAWLIFTSSKQQTIVNVTKRLRLYND